MTSTPFSIRLDDTIRADLQAEAKRLDRPASYLAAKAIRFYLDARRHEREVLMQRLAEADKGKFVSSERVEEWIDSWFTDNESPPPEADIIPSQR